jgi:hypothetical protein
MTNNERRLPRNSCACSGFQLIMKMQSLVGIVALCAAIQIAPLALAQNGNQTDGPAAARWRQKLANLSEAERQQLKSAHQKAMQDPAVRAAQIKMRQAHKEFRDAMRASMLKADPTIQPVLNKIPEGRAPRDS